MTRTRTCVFTEIYSGAPMRRSVASNPSAGTPFATVACRFATAGCSRNAARRLFEEGGDVGGERAPHLDVKDLGRSAPQDDLGFAQHRARAHPDREGAQVEIERAARGEERRRVCTAELDAQLTMTHVDE